MDEVEFLSWGLTCSRLQGPCRRKHASAGLVLGFPSAPAWKEQQPRGLRVASLGSELLYVVLGELLNLCTSDGGEITRVRGSIAAACNSSEVVRVKHGWQCPTP